MEKEELEQEEIYHVYESLLQENVIVESFQKQENHLQFRIKKAEQNKVQELLENKYPEYRIRQNNLVKLSIVGYGIIQDNQILDQVLAILKKYKIEVISVNLTQAKIEVLAKQIQDVSIVELHQALIKDKLLDKVSLE